MSELGISVDAEKSEISSALNSAILMVFMMGMYTVIYFGAMYIYLSRSSTKRRIILAVITMLFLCNVIVLGVQWYFTKWQFVDSGDTRDSVFLASFEAPNWVDIGVPLTSFTILVLADGLLIWRCFFVWNRSFRIISVPLLLIITEIALFVVRIIFTALYGDTSPTAAISNRINNLTFAAYLTTFGTSLLTTVLIAYRIYSASKRISSQRRFKHVINIVVESGAVYSLASLVSGLSAMLIRGGDISDTFAFSFSDYTTAFITIIAGMTATVLVARVSMLDSTTTFPSTSIHLSGLQFGPPSIRQTDNSSGMESSQLIAVDGNTVVEELRVEGKD